ncbi:MAG: hypothetical protein OXG35_13095 [Acidobacteria bacterium]|nr:hypothetical protein [Acidobacteriota bacterium]
MSTLLSQMLLTTSGVRSPASSRSWLRLSPCSPLFEKLPKVDPLNELPPSLGMMFTRTPPMATSAETAPISYESSSVWASFAFRVVQE